MTHAALPAGHDREVVPVVHASAAPGIDVDQDTDTSTDLDTPWDVIVWDDPVTLMSYVVWVFKKVLQVPESVASKLMLEVHNKGKALVASEPRERAEFLLQQLLSHGLKATVERSR